MKRPSMSACIVVAAWTLWLACGPTLADDANSTALSRPKLDAVVAQLRGNGRLWQKGLPVQQGPELALKAIFFTPENVSVLCDALAANPTDPNGLYVDARLLRQLTYSSPKTILAALPTVKDLCRRVSPLHKDFPPISDFDLEWLKKPTDDTKAAKAALKKRQDDKIARETPIARINEAIFSIQGRTFQLMAYSHDTKEYTQLAQALVLSEKDRSGIFLIIVQAIASEARKMTPEEGKCLYDALRPVGLELKYDRKRSYFNYARPVLKRDDVSTYETTDVSPGITLLKMLNRVATSCHSAEAPALKVPTEKQIAKYWADKNKAKRRKRPR